MAEREESRRLEGFVQVDDAYLGGERNGGKAGRGSENNQAFVITVETDATLEHPRFTVIESVPTFDNASITDWSRRRLAPEAEVYSDGLGAFRRFVDTGHAHTVLDTGGGRAATDAQGARWVNIVLSNVKRALDGVYHALKQHRYLAEAAYRFNRRFRLRDMVPRLARAMALCKLLPRADVARDEQLSLLRNDANQVGLKQHLRQKKALWHIWLRVNPYQVGTSLSTSIGSETALAPGVLPESMWKRLAPSLPLERGRPNRLAKDNRQMLEAMLWRLRTGTP